MTRRAFLVAGLAVLLLQLGLPDRVDAAAASRYTSLYNPYCAGYPFQCGSMEAGVAYQNPDSHIEIANVVFFSFTIGADWPLSGGYEGDAGCITYINHGPQDTTSVTFTWWPPLSPNPQPPLVIKRDDTVGVLQDRTAYIEPFGSRGRYASQCADVIAKGAFISAVTYADGTSWHAPPSAPDESVAQVTPILPPGARRLPEDAYARCSQGDGSPNETIGACTSVIKAFWIFRGGTFPLHGYLGQAFARAGKFELAIKEFGIVLRSSPNSPSTHNLRGYAYTRNGDYMAALSDFTEAEREKPSMSFPPLAINLLSGKATSNEIIAAANWTSRCQAEYFVGEWFLSKSDSPKAKTAFQSALDACMPESFEHKASSEELKRISP